MYVTRSRRRDLILFALLVVLLLYASRRLRVYYTFDPPARESGSR